MQVTIYSKPNCSYCEKAKNFFKNKKIGFHEVRVGDHITTSAYTAQTGMTSVPAIYLDDQLIGGYDDLVDYVVDNPDKF